MSFVVSSVTSRQKAISTYRENDRTPTAFEGTIRVCDVCTENDTVEEGADFF